MILDVEVKIEVLLELMGEIIEMIGFEMLRDEVFELGICRVLGRDEAEIGDVKDTRSD